MRPEADLGVDDLLRGQILEALARHQIAVVSRAQGDTHHLSQIGHKARQVAKRPEGWMPAIVTERRVGLVATRQRTDGRRTYRAFEVEVQLYFRQPPQHVHRINRRATQPGLMCCHHTMAPQIPAIAVVGVWCSHRCLKRP